MPSKKGLSQEAIAWITIGAVIVLAVGYFAVQTSSLARAIAEAALGLRPPRWSWIWRSLVMIIQPRRVTSGIHTVSWVSGVVTGHAGLCRLWITAPGSPG
jgi:hypothetical protein